MAYGPNAALSFRTHERAALPTATGSMTGDAYKVTGIPTTYIINPEGKVVWTGHPMGGLDEALEKAVAGTLLVPVSAGE